MPDALQSITQADFSAGAFPGLEDVPLNGVEDIVDGLLRDDGAIERRGGSVAFGPSLSSVTTLGWLFDGFLAAGPRTVHLGDSTLSVLDASDAAWATASVGSGSRRPAIVAGMLIFPAGSVLHSYGGQRATPASAAIGTGTFTNDSRKVTGAGTNFLSSFLPGSMLLMTGATTVALVAVESIQSDTEMTLATRYPLDTVSGVVMSFYSGALTKASFDMATGVEQSPHTKAALLGTPATAITTVSAVGERLFVARGPRVIMAEWANPFAFKPDEAHEMPAGVWVSAMEPLDDAMFVFTTAGVFRITNPLYDLTDDFGNAQQQMESVAPEMVLWGERGLASNERALVVPALDGIYLLSSGGQQAITGGVQRLYLEYVKAGYQPGQAQIFRGHYVLPIVSGTTWVDTLVCKLSSGAWVRWAGRANTHLWVRRTQQDGAASLLTASAGAGSLRDFTSAFQPAAAVKADDNGTAHQLKITSRSIMLSETIDHTLRFGRLRYELDDAASDNPTFTAEWSRGRPGSSFTALTGSASEGEDTFTWSLAKSGQQTRMRFTSNNAAAKAIVRAMEFKVRQHGRA